MWRFVLRENIRHLRALLLGEGSEDERRKLCTELRSAEQELSELEAASAHAWAAHNEGFAAALTVVLREAVARARADMGDIRLYEPDRGCLSVAAQVNLRREFLDHFAEVTADDGSVCGRALSTRAGVWVEDVETASFFAGKLDMARESEIRAVKSMPLVRSSGQLLGMVSFHFHNVQHWTKEDRAADGLLAAWLTTEIAAIRPDASR